MYHHLISVTMAPTLLSIILMFSSIAMVSVVVIADPAKDREECADQLVKLATCLPYVGGNAKAPTPDCCKGLKQVLKNNKKCLCVVVRDRDDPDYGLEINVTLALGLPTVCDAPANVSKCPELLKMDPQSKEAQVFYQLGNKNTLAATSPAPSPTTGAPTSAKSQGVNSSNRTVMKEFGLNAIFVSVLILNLMGLKWFV